MGRETVDKWTCDLCGNAAERTHRIWPKGRLVDPPEGWAVILWQSPHAKGSITKAICAACVKLIHKAQPIFCPRCVEIMRDQAEIAAAQREAEEEVAHS